MKQVLQHLGVLAAAVLLLLTWTAPAQAWEATVVRVSDGDTIAVMPVDPAPVPGGAGADGKPVRVRLYGIDAPEGPGSRWQAQPYSRQATDFVKDLLPKGARVSIMDMGYDKYTRTVAGVISLPDGKIAQEELLRAGFAWVYPKYCKDCRQWRALQDEAKAARRGLWRESGGTAPVPPWEWRHKKKAADRVP